VSRSAPPPAVSQRQPISGRITQLADAISPDSRASHVMSIAPKKERSPARSYADGERWFRG